MCAMRRKRLKITKIDQMTQKFIHSCFLNSLQKYSSGKENYFQQIVLDYLDIPLRKKMDLTSYLPLYTQLS